MNCKSNERQTNEQKSQYVKPRVELEDADDVRRTAFAACCADDNCGEFTHGSNPNLS